MKTFEKITDFSHNTIYVNYSNLTASLFSRKASDIFTQEMNFKSIDSLYNYTKVLIGDGYSIKF